MKIVNVTDKTRAALKKELEKEGWVSSHYLSRHYWNADSLRKKAKKGLIQAVQLTDGFSVTWYYSKNELDLLSKPHGEVKENE